MTKTLTQLIDDMQADRDRLAGVVERKIRSEGRDGFFEHPDSTVAADLISVLSHPNTPPEVRHEIVAGLRVVYLEMRQAFDGQEKPELTDGVVRTLRRLCDVVDGGDLTELKAEIASLALLARFKQVQRADVLEPLVRAAKSLLLKPDYKDLWYQLLSYSATAALAANALIHIDTEAPTRLVKMLAELWRKKLAAGWPVDVAFLMRLAERRNAQASHVNVFNNTERALFDSIRNDLLGREWSRVWIATLDQIQYLDIAQNARTGERATIIETIR